GLEHRLATMKGDVLARVWSADGKYMVFAHDADDANSAGEVWVAPLKTAESVHLLLRNISSFGTDLSPDGKWLAYTTDDSGRLEVDVVPFNPLATSANALAAGRWHVSTEGGSQPRSSPTGTELCCAYPPVRTISGRTVR